MSAKTKIAGLVTGLMALSVPLVYADSVMGDGKPMHQDGDWHHGQQDHMMGKVLGLTEDQEKQMKDLHQKQKDAMKSTFEQMKTSREAFDAEIVKAAPDMNKINDIQTQLKTIQGQMLDNHLNSLLAIKKIMTPEQFAGYVALKKERELMKHDKFEHKDGWGKEGGDKDKEEKEEKEDK